jgi:hypothetical protein
MYGPVDGSGVVEESFAGELTGTGAANSVARMYSKSPCGDFNLIVIVPAVSSALMPLGRCAMTRPTCGCLLRSLLVAKARG